MQFEESLVSVGLSVGGDHSQQIPIFVNQHKGKLIPRDTQSASRDSLQKPLSFARQNMFENLVRATCPQDDEDGPEDGDSEGCRDESETDEQQQQQQLRESCWQSTTSQQVMSKRMGQRLHLLKLLRQYLDMSQLI